MSEVTSPVILDSTGLEIVEALKALRQRQIQVVSLDETPLTAHAAVMEAEGVPQYVEDVSLFSAYGLTETGWYIFARIYAGGKIKVDASTTVSGAAGYIATPGEDHVDVAVRFEVAAIGRKVTVSWGGFADAIVFRATDLAIRNLDYRTTFYVYDLTEFVTWEYGLTVDTAFAPATRSYYTKSGDTYTKATVTDGDAVPAYYTAGVSYALTTDATFADGTTYYTKSGDTYTAAAVTAGEAVTADTYYVASTVYTQATGVFEDGVTYYTRSGDVYSEATVTAGEAIPAYYQHTKIIIQGATRNITYKFDDIIDCPMEFILPQIEDETHGCWFEMRFRHAGSYSMTLIPPTGVKVATEHTQAETAGFNTIDLHYNNIDGVKLWRFLNTHSTIPA